MTTKQKFIWGAVGLFVVVWFLNHPAHAGNLVGQAWHWVTGTVVPAVGTFLNHL